MCQSTATVEVFVQLEQEHSAFEAQKQQISQAEEPTIKADYARVTSKIR